MRVWHFSEQAYPQAWEADPVSLRVTLPNSHFDPKFGGKLLNRYLDDWAYCDEIGTGIMVNEHHSTATCLSSSCLLQMAILARETKKIPLLCLGVPLANRLDPVRVAEELSYIDCISDGRLEMGFVRGIQYENSAVNASPVNQAERLWEAHDLIVKAMSTHDGPFNWEGEFFHQRQVNIWPRPIQAPHPPVWVTTGSVGSVDKIAEKNATIALVNSGLRAKRLFARYRERIAELGRPRPPLNKFAYMSLVAVADTQEKAFERLHAIRGYLRTTPIVNPGLANPPGYVSPEINAEVLADPFKGQIGIIDRDSKPIDSRTCSHEALIDAGAAFAGTPDQVFEQIKRFHNDVGGLGNFIMMGQGGFLNHEETKENLRMFAKEVTPRLQDLKEPQDAEFERLERRREAAAG